MAGTEKNGKCAAFKAQAGKGRPKGVPNKMTAQIKDMIRQALDEAGGVSYLVEQAEANPKAFLTLVGKLVPLDVNATVDKTVTLKESRDAAVQAFYRGANATAEADRQRLQ